MRQILCIIIIFSISFFSCSSTVQLIQLPADTMDKTEYLQYIEWQKNLNDARNSVNLWNNIFIGALLGGVVASVAVDDDVSVNVAALVIGAITFYGDLGAREQYKKIYQIGINKGWVK